MGSRRKVLSQGLLAENVPGLFDATFAAPLQAIFQENGWPQATAYFEFHGPNSFAGQHEAEPHVLNLIDAAVHRKGLLLPGLFLTLFGHLPHADVLHRGRLTPALRGQIEAGTLAGMPPEGGGRRGRPLRLTWAAAEVQAQEPDVAGPAP